MDEVGEVRAPDGQEVLVAARAAASKASGETIVIEVGPVLAITTWFVISSGRNPRQVASIVEEVEGRVFEASGRKPLRVEGLDTMEWVLMDYGDIVVHAFVDDVRRHYEIERLYSDVPVIWSSLDEQPSGAGLPA